MSFIEDVGFTNAGSTDQVDVELPCCCEGGTEMVIMRRRKREERSGRVKSGLARLRLSVAGHGRTSMVVLAKRK